MNVDIRLKRQNINIADFYSRTKSYKKNKRNVGKLLKIKNGEIPTRHDL